MLWVVVTCNNLHVIQAVMSSRLAMQINQMTSDCFDSGHKQRVCIILLIRLTRGQCWIWFNGGVTALSLSIIRAVNADSSSLFLNATLGKKDYF